MKTTKSASPKEHSIKFVPQIPEEEIERFKKEMEKMGIDTSKGVVILGKNKEIVYKK